jgi:hypothetical protein
MRLLALLSYPPEILYPVVTEQYTEATSLPCRWDEDIFGVRSLMLKSCTLLKSEMGFLSTKCSHFIDNLPALFIRSDSWSYSQRRFTQYTNVHRRLRRVASG